MTHFLLGILFTQTLMMWALASRKRLRRAAQLLLGLANALDGRQYAEEVADTRTDELTSALVQLKCTRKKAAAAARAAVAQLPQGSFEDQFRAAVAQAA